MALGGLAGPRRSLRVELIATLAVLLMMAAVSLSLATELLGRERHIEQERARLTDHSRGLAIVVAPLVGGSAQPRNGAAVEQVLRASVGTLGIVGIEIHRAGERRHVLTTLGLPPTLPPPSVTEGKVRRSFETDDNFFVVDEPIRSFGRAAARDPLVLRVSTRPTPWTRVGDWKQIAIIAVGTGGVLLLLGGVLVEVQVLRPMREIRNAAKQVETGNLSVAVPEDGPIEVQQLAEAFNTMTASLRGQLDENAAQRDRLVRAEQLATVGRVAAGMAHELGNPLAAILGYVELLLDPRSEPALSAEQGQLLQRSRVQLERIQDTLGQLLEYSRPTKHAAGPVALVESLRHLMTMTKHDPRCQAVEITVVGDEALVATADATLLDQVVQNLVINASRAAAAPGGEADPTTELWVGVLDEHSDHVAIEVRDNGPGVPTENEARLFEPFFSTAPAGDGTGLGLAISLGLVESMGGTLTFEGAVEPEHTRPGARFRILLPKAADDIEASNA